LLIAGGLAAIMGDAVTSALQKPSATFYRRESAQIPAGRRQAISLSSPIRKRSTGMQFSSKLQMTAGTKLPHELGPSRIAARCTTRLRLQPINTGKC